MAIIMIISFYLAIAAWIDYKKHIIPNWLNFSMLLLRFAITPMIPISLENLLGALFGFLVFAIPAFFLKQDVGGDIKMFAVLGFWLGLEKTWMILELALIISLLIIFIRSKRGVPFAPPTFIATIILGLYGKLMP